MFYLKSEAFNSGDEIPIKYTGEGENLSPPLEWGDVPNGSMELTLICDDPDDPDAPGDEPFVHWVIYGMSEEVTGLPEGIPSQEAIEAPVRAVQGTNSFGDIGYGGPMPPPGHGWHNYHFRLYAVEKQLDLEPGATKSDLISAMKGHILSTCELVGKYHRDKFTHRRAV